MKRHVYYLERLGTVLGLALLFVILTLSFKAPKTK